MTHPIPSVCLAGQRAAAWLIAAVLVGAVGCAQFQSRGQSADEPEAKIDFKDVLTVGDVTDVSNALPLQVSGVGLVVGLDGTGGGTPPSEYRSMLEQQLLKAGVRDAKSEIDSPDHALVLVTALIPPGARRGDPLDIQITLPPGSKVTSLRGGFLRDCPLRNYDTTQHLDPAYQGANRLLPGHVLGHARGPLLVGFGPEEDENARLRQARVWDGGVSVIDRPFYLELKNDQKFARIANAVAQRINMLFPDEAHKQDSMARRRLLMLDEVAGQVNHTFDKHKLPTLAKGETARAVTRDVIYVQVPSAYHLNPERYLRVARLIPLREAPEARGRYRKALHDRLLDPANTITAALRLEALGRESLATLKEGLKSPHTLVRFAAAEALAYLGCGAGADELARLAERHEALRAYCLIAMASMDGALCYLRLSELLANPDAEVRYGAFRALRLLPREEQPDEVQGEMLGKSFWLHKVAPQSSPLVHACTSQHAEIVLFGEPARLQAPFKLRVGSEFLVTAEPGDDRCTVGRYVLSPASISRRQCSFRLEDVLRAMAELGGQYADAMDLIRQVASGRCRLTAPVRFDAMPVAVPVEDLAQEGKEPRLLKAEDDRPADEQRGDTPRAGGAGRQVTHAVSAETAKRD